MDGGRVCGNVSCGERWFCLKRQGTLNALTGRHRHECLDAVTIGCSAGDKETRGSLARL
jgi:hypothetical protein